MSIKDIFAKLPNYLGQAFSDGGLPSSSRLLFALSMIVVLTGWLHVCFHTHSLPDAISTGAAAGLGTAPYTVNRVTTAWGKDKT